MNRFDVAIIGGGLAGLAAATRLARLGAKTTVLERSDTLGGRARTDRAGGYAINRGPHALYRGKAGEKFLRELGIPIPGTRVSSSNTYALGGDELHPLPGGFVSLLTTTALDFSGKIELGRFMTELRLLDPSSLAGRSGADWLAQIRDDRARGVIASLARVATYTADLETIAAEVVAGQLRAAAFDGVTYVHGGWRSLVDGLAEAALGAGVVIETGAKVERILIDGGRAIGVEAKGRELGADAVLIAAGGPALAAKLSGSESLARHAEAALPIEVSALDVALDLRINPRVKFVSGLDRPLYFSVHSDTARVAPPGGALVSAMLYLAPDEAGDAKAHEAELERLFDRIQPGWRDHVVKKQFLPRITVAYAQVGPEHGLEGRPRVSVPDIDGLFVAGDWVGEDGVLADASLASAKAAAEAIAQQMIEKAA